MASKEKKIIESEDRLWAVRKRFKEAQEEVEDLGASIHSQQQQLEEYKHKYVHAQHYVEEQRKQIDQMQLQNDRIISEQVNLEVQKVKNEFQEKLNKLTPLYDVLVKTEQKLQEHQQMHLHAESNNEALERELQTYKEKVAEMKSQIEEIQNNQQFAEQEKAIMEQRVKEIERKFRDAVDENNALKVNIARMEDLTEQNKKKVEKKLHENAQLIAKLETVIEESARKVAKSKDRCDTVSKNMKDQTEDLGRLLQQTKASSKTACRENNTNNAKIFILKRSKVKNANANDNQLL